MAATPLFLPHPPHQSARLELERQISVRAYELYEARGREDVHEQEDWLRAEEEIKGRKARTATV